MDKLMQIGLVLAIGFVFVLVGIYLVSTVSVAIFPLAVTQLVALSGLGNFTFASLFATGSVMVLLLSLIVLLAFLGVIVGAVFIGMRYIKGDSR